MRSSPLAGNVKGVSFLPKGALKELTCQYIVDQYVHVLLFLTCL